MTIIYLIIFSTLYSVYQSTIFQLYFNSNFICRLSYKKTYLMYVVFAFIIKILLSSQYALLNAIIFIITLTLLTKILFKGKTSKIMFHVLFLSTIMLSSEFFIFAWFSQNNDLNYISFKEISNYDMFRYFAISCISMCITVLSVYIALRNKIDKVIEFNTIKYIKLSFVPFISLLCIFLLYVVGNSNNNNIIIYVFIIISNITLILIYNQEIISKQNMQEYLQFKYENNLYKNIIDNNESYMHLKHDFKNILITIKYRLEKGNIIGAKDQINGLIGDYFVSDNELSGCIAIDAILQNKISIIKNEGIEYNLKFQIPSDLEIGDTNSIAIIVGNLVDNAIEGVLRTSSLKKNISISIIFYGNKLIMKVTNTANELNINFDNKVILSEKAKNRIGVGVSSIKNRVELLNGYYDFAYSNNIFTVTITIPVY